MFGAILFLLISICDNISGYKPMLAKGPSKRPEEPDYKVSMVASEEHAGSPALFTHGESPVWDADTQSLYFVDVLEQNVHRLHYGTGQIFTKHIGYGQVNVVALVEGSSRLLVTVRAGLYLLDWQTEGDAALRLLATVDDGMPDNVINEGKPDADGRFVAGTKGPQTGDDVVIDKATLYSFDQNSLQNPRALLRPVSISNGISWSPNNTVMYYVDSPTQKIEAFDYDLLTGDIGNRRTVFDITEHGYTDAIPDGMTIDTEGHLWVALMFGGAVLHINPDCGELIAAYTLPAARVTSLCWGGPRLDELFVTTSREAPLGGAVFTIRGTQRRGLAPNKFHFHDADRY
ncbi:regucalcin-like [Cydia strobilella]|uniref:regucalcin-like n=1 Tax=Cydia strobilella TaxID=1100964 RepID=UPI003005F877